MDHGAHIASDEEKLNTLLGKEAPDFTLTSYDGKKFNLKEQRGKKVVLFFTEGAMCYPSCWNQIVAFGKDNAFNNEDTMVLNIMVDTKNDWKKAVDKMPELGASTVLLDLTKNVSKDYGMLEALYMMNKVSQDFMIRPMGIFQLIDYVGIDVLVDCRQKFHIVAGRH